ncbi:hypothetical protein T484DRAFT_1824899 [Baffinella frigidus]|nr:hypothetical protein T484DRAFT_1824899 [Cryptophyta sp. CCMP2293]
MRPNPPPRQEARLDSIELSIFRHPTNFVEEGFQNVPYSAPSAPGAPQQRRQADEGLQAPTNTEPSGVPPFGEPTGGDAEDDRVPLIRKATEYAHSGMDPANARRNARENLGDEVADSWENNRREVISEFHLKLRPWLITFFYESLPIFLAAAALS